MEKVIERMQRDMAYLVRCSWQLKAANKQLTYQLAEFKKEDKNGLRRKFGRSLR